MFFGSALLLQSDPALLPTGVKARLQASALDLGPPGYDRDYGWGFVDPMALFGGPSPFPPHDSFTAVLAPGTTWAYEFSVNDHAYPVAVTVIEQSGYLEGSLGDPFWWEPAISVRLFYPDGEAVRFSDCPNGGLADTWCGLWGRVQIATWDTPAHPPVAGTYRIEVSIMPMGDEFGSSATFSVDIFHG